MINLQKTTKRLSTFLTTAFLMTVLTSTAFAGNASIEIPEGQGAGNNTFYRGRCVRADLYYDTEGSSVVSFDMVIHYNSNYIEVYPNSGCTGSPADDNEGSLKPFSNLSSNFTTYNINKNRDANIIASPSTWELYLAGFNTTGTNSSGRMGSFYFKVINDGSSEDFDFITSGSLFSKLTISGGTNVLTSAPSKTVVLNPDTNNPNLIPSSPTDGQNNVLVIDNINFTAYDNPSTTNLGDSHTGIDNSLTNISISGPNAGGPYNPFSQGDCTTTNNNRYPSCNNTINPSLNLYYDTQYTVNWTVEDLGLSSAGQHHTRSGSYQFRTEADVDDPTFIPTNPTAGQGNASTSTNIQLTLRDIKNPQGYPGVGFTDTSSFKVTVSCPNWGTQVYTGSALNATANGTNDYGRVYRYKLDIDPATNFPQNETVTVKVEAQDAVGNRLNSNNTYTFTTVDTTPPLCEAFNPEENVVDAETDDDIVFECTDTGVGVNLNSLNVLIDGKNYTKSGLNQFSYSSITNGYEITIDPDSDFGDNYAFEVVLDVKDNSNNSARYSYGLATGGSSTCEDGECVEFPMDGSISIEGSSYKVEIDENGQVTFTDDNLDFSCTVGSIITIGGKDYLVELINGVITLTEVTVGSDGTATQVPGTENLVCVPESEWQACQEDGGMSSTPEEMNSVVLTNVNDESVVDESITIIVEKERVIAYGEANPFANVTLLIESDPLTFHTTADNQGNWIIDMSNQIEPGTHRVYSAIQDLGSGDIIDKKYLVEIEVKADTEVNVQDMDGDEIVEHFTNLTNTELFELLNQLSPNQIHQILSQLTPDQIFDLLNRLNGDQLYALFDKLTGDQLAALLEKLSEEQRRKLLLGLVGENEAQIVRNSVRNVAEVIPEPVKQATNTAVAATGLGAILAALANIISQLGGLSSNIFFKLFQALGLVPKRKPKGMVFDSQTYEGIPFAILNIKSITLENQNGHSDIQETVVTNEFGVYEGIKLPPGQYQTTVTHPSYSFPTRINKPVYATEADFYKGDTITVNKSNEITSLMIPMDRTAKKVAGQKNKKIRLFVKQFFNRLGFLTYVFFILSILIVIAKPSIWNWSMLALYTLLTGYKIRDNLKKPIVYGTICDHNGYPIKYAIVKLNYSGSGKLAGIVNTDKEGKFEFYSNKEKYYISAMKENYVVSSRSSMSLREIDARKGRQEVTVVMQPIQNQNSKSKTD